jgi:hypothetical protein
MGLAQSLRAARARGPSSAVHRRRTLLLASLVTVNLPSTARADEPSIAQCIAASDHGLDLRRHGKLIDARGVTAQCAVPACGDAISHVCQTRVAEIQAALPTIVFSPADETGKDLVGAQVKVDGAARGEALDGRPLTADPGPHTFLFEAPGRPSVSREFILVEGMKGRNERIDLGRETAPQAATHGDGDGQRTAGWLVGAGGVVAVGLGALFGLLVKSKYSEQKSDCSPAPAACTKWAGANSAHSAAIRDAAISDVAFAVGGAALATGIVLLLAAPGGAPTEHAAEVRIAPALGPSFGGFTLQAAVP